MAAPVAVVGELSMRALYKHVLRAAKSFPSVKKAGIIREIRTEFRANKDLTDPLQIQHCRAVAERGLSDMQAYGGAVQSQNFDLHLKGACS
jgi:LYR motif-containing protein 4